VAFRLLERSFLRQTEVIPMEGLAVEGMEIVLVIIADVEWAQTPLFLQDSDLVDIPFAREDREDGSGEHSESSSGSNSNDSDDRSFEAMDGDTFSSLYLSFLFPSV
jgi:hypothetical protein